MEPDREEKERGPAWPLAYPRKGAAKRRGARSPRGRENVATRKNGSGETARSRRRLGHLLENLVPVRPESRLAYRDRWRDNATGTKRIVGHEGVGRAVDVDFTGHWG